MTLPIPFLQKRSFWIYPNTTFATPYWEQNEWKRRHGYQFPYDIYLLLQWAVSLSLDLFFYYFLIHFITTPQDESSLDATWNLVKEWPLAVEQGLVSSSWFGAIHARQVMAIICVGVKMQSVVVSFIDTEDPIIKANQVSRSKTYVKKYGISVIDPYTSICGICQIKVAKSTRHCKLCNKCIDGMDHHCKWLNCCIGRANYRIFFIMVISAFISLAWYSTLALYVVFLCFYRRNIFMLYVIQMLNLTHARNPLETMTQKYYLCMAVACFVAIFAVTALVAVTWLLGFHVRLAFLNMTTIEFISHPMYQRTLSRGNSTDDEYSDDTEKDDYSANLDYYNEQDLEDETDDKPWRGSWKANTSGSLKQEGHVMGLLNAWIHKTFRRLSGRAGHGYGRLNDGSEGNYGGGKDVGFGIGIGKFFYWFRKYNMTSHQQRQRQRRSHASTWRQYGGMRRQQQDSLSNSRDDINLEEILATESLGPIATTLGNGGPDYDDDMGLDTNILNQDYTTVDQHYYGNSSNISSRYLLSSLEKRPNAIRSVFSTTLTPSKTTRIFDNIDNDPKANLYSLSPDTISID